MTSSAITTVLVDDHTLLRQGIVSMLSKFADVKVVGQAGNGIEGLRIIAREQPDVAILDITMQGMSGIEMIPAIRGVATKTGIVMYSMHDNADFIQQAMQAGSLGYILKLDPPTELETAIRKVHGGQTYLSPTVATKIIDTMITGNQPAPHKQSTSLTPREQEIASLIGQGFDTAKVATILYISPKTVRVHRANIMKKLGCKSTSELIVRLHDQLQKQNRPT